MIKRIKWKNYKSLGNLELDFLKDDGTPYSTIVLAGENGTGKTTILETIARYLNKTSIEPFEYIEYFVNNRTYVATPIEFNASLGFHHRRCEEDETEVYIHAGKNYSENNIDNDLEDIRHYGVAYSKARSGFKTNPVKSVTTQMVDNNKYELDDSDDFTQIKQLLVDIDGHDSSEWMKKCLEGGLSDQKFVDFKKESKAFRFEKAFNEFFDSVKYNGIDNNNPNEKRILFTKHGKLISVDELSTGEKQIVFRGAHLLKNVNNISDGIVLIDEPELSMHPIWQKKILSFYRELFTSNDTQSVQMIIATHSEYLVQSALKERGDVLVIVLSDNNGSVRARKITEPFVLPVITVAETNYLAFGVPTTDYHIELYGYLQTKTGNHYIEDCDNYITQQSQYDSSKHERIDNSYHGHHYKTLPTYIRNALDHPDSGRTFTDEEFEESIKLLIDLCR